MTKRCSTCRGELPFDRFNKNRSTVTGLANECRACQKAYATRHRQQNHERLKAGAKESYKKHRDKRIANAKAYYRKNRRRLLTYRVLWSKKNPDAQRAIARRYYHANLGGHAEYRRIYNQVNRKKRRAHAKVAAALRKGVLVRPQACQRCGTSGRVDAHHPNYDKPLMVDWLCRSCHQTEHAKSAA